MKKKRNRPLLPKYQRKRIPKRVLGIQWDDLTEEQKQAFIDEQVRIVKNIKN
jgi:ABC-type transporter MlaC component